MSGASYRQCARTTARTVGGVANHASWEIAGAGSILSCIACIIWKMVWVSRLDDTLNGYKKCFVYGGKMSILKTCCQEGVFFLSTFRILMSSRRFVRAAVHFGAQGLPPTRFVW
jgi:hypothetical protein